LQPKKSLLKGLIWIVVWNLKIMLEKEVFTAWRFHQLGGLRTSWFIFH
jgi:hypothetical protein